MLRSALNSVSNEPARRERGAAVVDFVLVLVVLVPLVPRDPAGRAGDAGAQHPGRGRLRGRPGRGDRRPRPGRRGGGHPGADRRCDRRAVRRGRHCPVGVDRRRRQVWKSRCARRCRRWVWAARRSSSRWRGGRSRSRPVSLGRLDHRGRAAAPLVELVWLGILLLVPILWIVLSVFEVQRGAFARSAAARSAGRAYALAPTDAEGERRARAVARQALADQGLEAAPLQVVGHLYAVPPRLPQRHLGDHCPDRHPGRPAADARRARRRPAELRPRRVAHGSDRAVPGGRRCRAVTTPRTSAARCRC